MMDGDGPYLAEEEVTKGPILRRLPHQGERLQNQLFILSFCIIAMFVLLCTILYRLK